MTTQSRYIAIALASLIALTIGDAILLAITPVTFAPSTAYYVMTGPLWAVSLLAAPAFVMYRLREDETLTGRTIHRIAESVDILVRYTVLLVALGVVAVICTYLTNALAHPFKDADLAALDRALGFDWPTFLAWTNRSPDLVWLLRTAYHSTGLQMTLVFIYMAAIKKPERLAEFVALFGLTSILAYLGLLLVPAEGAYAFFNPARETFSHYSAISGMWHHEALTAIRSPSPVFDFATPEGLVTFPSYHTVLAIMTVYAVRDRYVAPLVLLWNGLVVIGTITEGGHYLIDIIVGAAVALVSILVVRTAGGASFRPAGRQRSAA